MEYSIEIKQYYISYNIVLKKVIGTEKPKSKEKGEKAWYLIQDRHY